MKLGGKNQKTGFIHIAEIVDINDNADNVIGVKYMVKCGSNLYNWPNESKQEYSSQSGSEVYKVKAPVLANERSQFRFDPKDLDSVKSAVIKDHALVPRFY